MTPSSFPRSRASNHPRAIQSCHGELVQLVLGAHDVAWVIDPTNTNRVERTNQKVRSLVDGELCVIRFKVRYIDPLRVAL